MYSLCEFFFDDRDTDLSFHKEIVLEGILRLQLSICLSCTFMSLYCHVITCKLLCAQISECVVLQVRNVFLRSLKHGGTRLFDHFYYFLDSFIHTVLSEILVKPINIFQLLNSLLIKNYKKVLVSTQNQSIGIDVICMTFEGQIDSHPYSKISSRC